MEKITFENLQETLYHEKLENGLDVYVLPKRGFSKTYVTFTTKYGSIDSVFVPRGKEEMVRVPDGIAHFLEHKMFEKEEGDVFQKFGENGASANAFTSYTRTSYLFSTTEKLYDNTKVLLDFVQQPYFTEQTVEKEKGIIGQEITMYEDNPDWRLYLGTIQNLYKQHPIHIDILGTYDSIDKITAEHLYECYETFYHPSNMVFFAIGAVDPEEMIEFVKKDQSSKTFSEPEEVVRDKHEEPSEAGIPSKSISMDVTKPKFSYGMKCDRTDLNGDELLRQELAVSLAMDILFGRSSDFYSKAYAEGWIDESYGYEFNLEKSFGFAVISSDTEHMDELEQLINTTIQSTAGNWSISDEDLERARKKRIGQYMRSLNSIEFIANQFTHYLFNDMNLFDILPVLEQLDGDDLKEAFGTIADPKSHTVFKIIPAGQAK
ncbi:EF-P 5-aminopentanol modification-associated protein YfmH [Sporosarcina cyprini]|uniref:EF-P 5-aminopentanol modification-associated protein YfmH n=1 Tax=Sporosarcina cyprini TaxID=2910523 RepID=UPI001EDD8D3A|nr:pitrilysin family protein [Sporosarcina cyprini]MCG3090039.1 insulinase family protein [Sporosarcina cyprini]